MKAYKRWVCGLLAGLMALLAACAATVYIVDPCLYYRLPQRWQPVFFNERYQAAGLARNVEADTLLLGTSMVANYRPSQVEEVFGGHAQRITIPDGYLSEFTQVLDVSFGAQQPEQVIVALDLNILTRSESGVTGAMPEYLYNENRLDDVKYLLNKDTLYYSVYTILTNLAGKGEELDKAFIWPEDTWWNHMTALDNYERPEVAAETLPADAYLSDVEANLEIIRGWAEAHPETTFRLFLSPYSMLHWDKMARQGQTDAMLTALEAVCQGLMGMENVALYGFILDREIVADLDYYGDHIHHSGEAGQLVLEKIAAGEMLLTEENLQETLANWRSFVVHYDYEPYWTEAFWWAWNIAHGAPIVWQPED